MKIRLTADACSYIVVIVIALITIVAGLRMPDFQSKLLPLVLGGSVLVLAAAGLWRDIRSEDKTRATATEAENGSEQKVGGGQYLVVVVWTAGFILAIFLVGFLISMPLFIFSYMKTHNVRWLTSIVCAVVTTAIIYFGFQTLLGVELYPGLLFTWLRR